MTDMKHIDFRTITDDASVKCRYEWDQELESLEGLYKFTEECMKAAIIADREGRWISFKEDTPEQGELILICRDLIERNQYYVAVWSEEQERYAKLNNITHWQPITQPTEERG